MPFSHQGGRTFMGADCQSTLGHFHDERKSASWQRESSRQIPKSSEGSWCSAEKRCTSSDTKGYHLVDPLFKPMVSSYCENCGWPLATGSLYCPRCGSEVGSAHSPKKILEPLFLIALAVAMFIVLFFFWLLFIVPSTIPVGCCLVPVTVVVSQMVQGSGITGAPIGGGGTWEADLATL